MPRQKRQKHYVIMWVYPYHATTKDLRFQYVQATSVDDAVEKSGNPFDYPIVMTEDRARKLAARLISYAKRMTLARAKKRPVVAKKYPVTSGRRKHPEASADDFYA